jgi:hypothetical protein
MADDSLGQLVLFTSVSAVGLSFSINKFRHFKQLTYSSLIIYLLIFSLSLYLLSLALIDTGLYIRVPHLWRLFTALAYVNAPLCFLFIRVILTNRQTFKRTDLWVAVPALIHLIDMLPFILSGREIKLEAVRAVMNDGNALILEIEGFLLPGLNSWLKALVGLSMMIGQLLMLSVACHHFTKGEGSNEKTDRRLFRWLWALTGVLAATIFFIMFQFAFTILPGWNMQQVIMAAMTVSVIFIMISLPLVPGLTRGFKHPLAKSDLFF